MKSILISIPDLMFETRIADAARKQGHRVDVFSQERISSANLIILGLENNRDWRGIVKSARAHDVPILAFAGHTRAELLREAREESCTRVVVNSEIVEDFPKLLDVLLSHKRAEHSRLSQR